MTRIITVEAPLGGINRRFGYQAQPPFTCYDAVNFWPIDPLNGRAVLTTRPCLVEFTPVLALEPVNFICRINGATPGQPPQSLVAASGGNLYWLDDSEWVAATGAQADEIPTGTAVYGAAFLQEVFIPKFNDKPTVFNYATGIAATIVETEGTCPSDMRMFAVWQGCIWGSGQRATPHLLHGCRTGFSKDWDASVPLSDESGAFSTAGESEGLIRGEVTALMPHTDDLMVVSTLEGLVAMRGHPRRGGVILDLARNGTILGPGAWTHAPDGNAFFMTRSGLMMLGTEAESKPVLISPDKIPADLTGLQYDPEDPTISVCYDGAYNGIYIIDRNVFNPQAWWYDLNAGGFYRMQFHLMEAEGESYPYVLTEYEPSVAPLSSGVLFGGSLKTVTGGSAFGIGRMSSLDLVSEEIIASAKIGPMLIGKDGRSRSKIRELRVNAQIEASGPSTIKVAVDADAFGVISRLEADAAQYEANLLRVQTNNGICFPQVSGSAAGIEISHTAGGRIAFENAVMDTDDAGKNRQAPYRPI